MPWNYLQIVNDADGIATITLHRPEKLNALNAEMLHALHEALQQLEADESVRALILTGSGEKAFAAGADIAGIAGQSPVSATRSSRRGQRIFRRLETLEKPSIAAINGFALGGGLELAMACTLRIAADSARLGLPEVKLGIIPGYGGTQRLARLVGRGRAMELLLTGEPIDAAEAYRIGLVNRVVSAADLLPACKELLKKMIVNGPIALALVMRAVDSGLDSGLDEALEMESAAFGVAAGTGDCREGIAAFLQKRKPVFTGQ
jgi:enoyl-CoA hydratase